MGVFKNISKPLRRQYSSSAFTWQVPKTAHWVLQPKRVGTGIPTLLMQQSPPFSFCPVSWLLSTVLAAELEGSSGRYALTICECSPWDWRHAWLPTRPSINRSEFQAAFDTRRWASTWQDHANRGTGRIWRSHSALYLHRNTSSMIRWNLWLHLGMDPIWMWERLGCRATPMLKPRRFLGTSQLSETFINIPLKWQL